MSFHLKELTEENYKECCSIYQEWLKYHNSNAVTSTDMVESIKLSKSPCYFQTHDYPRFKYGFYKEAELCALMAIDDPNQYDEHSVATIDDILFNPGSDWSDILYNLIMHYQKKGPGALNIDTQLMDHHPWIQSALTEYGGIRMPIPHKNSVLSGYEKDDIIDVWLPTTVEEKVHTQYRTVVPFYRNEEAKWDFNVTIKLNDVEHITRGRILSYKLKNEDWSSKTKKFEQKTIAALKLVFEKPVFLIKEHDDQLFEIQVNDKHYKVDCECDYMWCEHARNCRINKIWADELCAHDPYINKSYSLIYGLVVPDPSVSEKESKFHPVAHRFGNWLGKFPSVQRHSKTTAVVFRITEPCEPSKFSNTFNVSNLWPGEVSFEDTGKPPFVSKPAIEECVDDNVGYQYLIWTREYHQKGEPVLKHGHTIQPPNNRIERLQKGYTKGLCC